MLVEKYRPKKLDEVIGQDHVKAVIREMIRKYRSGETRVIPHMLFFGPPGTGKTTMAYVLANELGIDIVEYNASIERGVEFVEEVLAPLSMRKGRRIIFLDEADYMTPNSQAMLRRILERTAQRSIETKGYDMNVFILSANYIYRIIEPIKSRCIQLPFTKLSDKLIIDRLIDIALNEGIKVENDNDIELVAKAIEIIVRESRGDMRKALNTLERILLSIKSGKLTPEIVITLLEPGLPKKLFRIIINEKDIYSALRELEDSIITNKVDPHEFLHEFSQTIVEFTELNRDKLDVESKKKLLTILCRIRDIEDALIKGASPLIQLSALLVETWSAIHTVPNMNEILSAIAVARGLE